jgi:predicted amidohydrolase YtcJ
VREPRLWTGGRIFTGRRYAEALLVEGGSVVAVGPESEVRRSAPTGTEVVPLGGTVVLPGLIDAHLHLEGLARLRSSLDLSPVRDLDDLLRRVREWAEAHPTGPVSGLGLDVERSLGGRWPTRADLDRAVPDRPVVLRHVSGHAAVGNGPALAAASVESRTAAEDQGRIGRGEDGRPNGLLFEGAMSWWSPLFSATPSEGDLVATLETLASLGLTTVSSMAASAGELAVVRSLAAGDRLPIRVRTYVPLLRVGELGSADLAPAGPPGQFAVVGSKGFTDGAFGTRTAWLFEPYTDGPDGSGLPVESDEALSGALEASAALGLAPALHAIGDRAVARAARLLAPYVGRPGAPARIEHVGLTPPAVLSLLDQVRPALVVQPGFLWSDFWLPRRLGPDRAGWAYVFRTLLDRGHLVAGSSDAPYDPPDPWRGMRAAVERRDAWGRSANPDLREALTHEEAVRLYTRNAGAVLGEPVYGTLEPGTPADLVILTARGLGEAFRSGVRAVRETWVGGVQRFDAGAGPGAVR